MSARTLRNLVIALALAVAVYAGIRIARAMGGDAPGDGGPVATALARVDTGAVDEVRIAGPDATVSLRHGGSPAGWLVDGYPADSAVIRRLLTALADADVRSIVSTNPDNHARLGVSRDSAWRLEVRPSAGEPVTILVGDVGPGFETSYVRLPEANEVYMVAGNLNDAVSHEADEWRDPTIVRLDTAAVDRLVIDGAGEDGGTVVLARVEIDEGAGADAESGAESGAGADGAVTESAATDGAGAAHSVWRVGGDDGVPADSAAVRRLLSDLADLRATGFAPDTAHTPEGPDRRIVALGAGGDTLAHLRVYDPPDVPQGEEGEVATGQEDVRVEVAGESTLFELPPWRADELTPGREELTVDEED